MKSTFQDETGSIIGMISMVGLAMALTATFIIGAEPLAILAIAAFAIGCIGAAGLLWGESAIEAVRTLRTPLRISPEAVDIIIARACADPQGAGTMVQTLKNAIGSHSHRNPQALDALDWFVPSSRTRSRWRVSDNILSVEVDHPDFRIAHGRLYVRRELLPDTVVTAIERMPLADLIEIPILRAENIVDATDIRMKPDAVVFEIFRDRRDINEIIQALEAIHARCMDSERLDTLWTPPLGA